MSKLIQFGFLTSSLSQNTNTPFELSTGGGLSAQAYTVEVTINHTQTASIASTTDFMFLKNVIANMSLEIGAGKKPIDLPVRDMLLRMLKDRGGLSISIDKTTLNTATESKMILTIDMANVNGLNPQDTLLHTWEHGHRVLDIKGGAFDEVATCTINSVQVTVYEHFKKDAKNIDRNEDGSPSNIMRKPIAREFSIVGDETERELKFPKGVLITGATIYAIDNSGKIVDGCIKHIKVRNGDDNRHTVGFDSLNRMNRVSKMFNNQTNAYWNNVAFLDLSQGEAKQGVHTGMIDNQAYAFYFDLTENGHTNPKVRVVFDTISRAG